MITNKHDFPETIVRALSKYVYTGTGADITASKIGAPPRIVALQKIHHNSLDTDISEMMPSLLGSAIHNIIEQGAAAGHLVEERISTTFMDWTVSGQPDSLELLPGALRDWKSCRVDSFQIKKREGFREWTEQLNTYRWLFHRNGVEVNSLITSAFLVDWSPSVALRQKDYPLHSMPQIPIPMWSLSDTEAWIASRITLHKAALENLPLCTDEDRWKRDTYAILAKGRKRAIRVFDDEASAHAYLLANPDPKHYIELRPGQSRRCALYCPVASVCDQWASDPQNHTEDLALLYGDQ